MDETALTTEGAIQVAGVAPGTIIAQISVALIAVAVTAVYILKNLPDSPPIEHPSPRRTRGRRVDRSPQRDAHHSVEGFDESARDDAVDAGASTSRRGTRENDQGASHSSSLEEYRAIISNDDYQDLCSTPDADKKSAKRKGSKEWPTSLESIDEEDEEEESKRSKTRRDAQGEEPKPKQSPTRGSRVPKWYFSKESSGIPTLPKDRDLDDHFDQIANNNSSEYIDEARKTAITGFRGPSIGIVQRKPWPKDGTTGSSSPNAHEYGVNINNDFQTISQSEAADSNYGSIARRDFLLKGQVAKASFNHAERIYVPDIRILEPNVSSNGYVVGSEGPGGDGSEWVETHASTVRLPGKSHDELTAEVVRITLDDDEDGDTSDASREIARVFKPTPKPRTSITGTRPGTSHSTQVSKTAPPRVTKTPTPQNAQHSNSDIDLNRREERALNTGAGQPSTNSNEGLYKQTKLGDSVTSMKSDATLKLGVQTRTHFIESDNIDTVDNTHNGLPAVALHGKTHTGSRAFTLVGSKPRPAELPVTLSSLNTHVVQAEINSIPDTETSVSPTDTQNAPWGRTVKKIQLATSRSPYEIGATSLSTRLPYDENNKQRVNSAIITAQPESVHLEKRSEIRDKSPTASAGRNLETKPAQVTDGKGNHTSIAHGNELNGRSSCDGESQGETTELDELRATLTESLPLKRPKELLLNETKSKKRDISPTSKSDNPYSRESDHGRSDSEVSVTSPSDVISEQLERVRKSLDKLKAPDWYKKSSHYQRVVNKRPHAKSVVSDSESEPRMTRSPSSCPSDCWSVTSSADEAAASQPAVSTKLAFQSEARYRRDFPASLYHEPIRNAVSCVELPTRSSIQTPSGDLLNSLSQADNRDPCQSADDTIYSQPFHNQTSSSLKDVNYDVPRTQSSPSRGLRLRSKSVGDNLDQITYFDSLAVKRLERHMYDSIFFVTGYLCDSDDYNLDEGTRSDENNLGSPPDDSVDDMEYPRRTYGSNTTGSYARDSFSPQSGNLQNGNGFFNSRIEIDKFSKDHESESKHFTPATSGPELNDAMEPQSPRTPVPAPRRNIMGSAVMRGYPTLTDTHVGEELKPDPRYNPDGSRNTKISPRFAMVTPSHGKKESPRSSPINTSPRRTNVKILITDTTLDDDDSDPSLERQSDQDQVSSSDQETVVDATSWTPLDLVKLKDSEFAAVVSVITSRHMQPGNRSGMYLPGSGLVPQQEVTMEEIVDSLLGLPYQRATSAVDLNSSGYRGSSSTSSPLTCSTPDLSSSWSPGQGSTSVSSSDKSHSVDSLYGEGDTNVLNAIIFGRKRIEGDGYPSYEEDGGDAVGDEIIMVKCSYKKCAKTKELEEARKCYKTCHNCYTYYCSRQCRKLHWPRHKKRCLFGRVNSACKHVLYHSRYNEQLQSDLSRVARTGYLSRGRGAILLIFPDTEAAENYTSKGFDALPSPPTYSTVRELQTLELFGDHMKFLLEMCCSYDPENKFVINVAIMASGEQHRGHRPRHSDMAVKKCAKLKLSLMNRNTDPSGKAADPVPDTLILTSPTGPQGDGILDRKARQVCFVHIQRQLRQRGVSLRHQHAEIYDKLCRWVELHEHFVPVTIYPVDENTGTRFMCVLMPESEPNELGWVNNPELLEDIDLDAELEKLENVAGLVVTDL